MTEAIPAFKDMLERTRHRSASGAATEADVRSDAQPPQRNPRSGKEDAAPVSSGAQAVDVPLSYALPRARLSRSYGNGHAQLMLPSAKTCRRNPTRQPAQAERLRPRCPVRLRHRSHGQVCGLHRGRKLGRRGQYPSFPRRCRCPPVLLPAGSIPGSAGIEASPARAAKIASSPAPQIITIEWRSRHISLPTAPMCNHSGGDDLHRPLNGSDPKGRNRAPRCLYNLAQRTCGPRRARPRRSGECLEDQQHMLLG